MGLSRPRTPRRVLQEAKSALLHAARTYLDQVLLEGTPRPPSTPGPPNLLIGPLPRRPNRPPYPFTASRLHELQPVRFQTVPRKHLYTLMLHTLHALTLVSRPDTKWRDLLPPLEGEQPPWAASVGQSIFHLGSEAHRGHQLAAPSWSCEHGHILGAVHPRPRYLSLLRSEGNPGARIFGVRQAEAPVPAPHKSPIMFLVAFFPSPFYLCTPHPWPHKVVGSPS
ncbi:unnamed protein product [Natator depressus]